MKVLVLGGSGMLGHKVFQILRGRFPQTACTVRSRIAADPLRSIGLFQQGNVFEGVDATDFTTLQRVFHLYRPQAVVNCMGLIKQRPEAVSMSKCMAINALFPRRLSELCEEIHARLIHFSTDCVFSGLRGGYVEADRPDADDAYGISKRAGELHAPHVLTLRTSFVGRELSRFSSLLEWFISRDGGSVRGYTHTIFSGVTSRFLGHLLGDLLERHPDLWGLYHVAGEAISKYDLLCLLRSALGLDIEILPDAGPRCDRSLNGDALKRDTGIVVPSWQDLVRDLALDPTPYDAWRKAYEAA
jgi:dTDP-4-dehydrorhamnose reductase